LKGGNMDDISSLLLEVRGIANQEFDGHFCIFKFTTGYKSLFGTIDLDTGKGRDIIREVPSFLTLNESLMYLIKYKLNSHDSLFGLSAYRKPVRV
jgi:hypothetical protein